MHVAYSKVSPITGNKMATDAKQLRAVKIHFRNAKDEEKGFYTLLTSGMPAYASTNDRYIVNAIQCKLLEENGIEFARD